MAAFATLVCQRNCVFLCKGTKLKNSAKPNSRTVCRFLPRYAFSPLIPAVWGFGLGLLGGQGFIGAKAPLDPLCRALWHRASFWQPLQPWFVKETAFFFAKAQNCKKLGFLRQFAGFRFGAFLVVQEWGWRTSRGMFCVVFMWFLRGCGAGLGARGSRVFVSFFIYFICSPTNDSLLFLFSGG